MSESGETIQSSGSLTLEGLMKAIEVMYDHEPEPTPQVHSWWRGFPILVDPTLPDDTIKIGDARLTNIKKD